VVHPTASLPVRQFDAGEGPPCAHRPHIPDLSEEQRVAVDALTEGIRRGLRKQTLGGYAGTGKTTLIRVLKQRLPRFAVCAFTGKAANMLRRKGIAEASTIHSAIYIPIEGRDGEIRFELRESMGPDVSGFIVDEASMVGRTIHDDLTRFGLPIIFVGDHGQLEPVNSDFNLMAKPDYTLETIHRNSGEIPRFAEWLRHGKPSRDFRPESDAVVLLGAAGIEDATVLAADQVICAFNNTRVECNRHIRSISGRVALVEVGERVMCLRNDRDAGLFNGMQGTVTAVTACEGRISIDFSTYDGSYHGLPVDRDQFGKEKGPDQSVRHLHPFDYAYVITAHKAQGDEWKRVLVMEQKCKHWDHRRWTYTAASRAQEKLVWWTGGAR
jgi:exodeoxyribonuclease V